MGFLDNLKGMATSALGADQHSALATAAAEALGNQQGGIGGLVAKFEQNGLGAVANSWVGTGSNLPVSPDQLQQVLGSQQIAQLAAKVGISPDLARTGLAAILPMLVDKATPNGKIPPGGGNLAAGLAAR